MRNAFRKQLIRHTVYVVLTDIQGRYCLQLRSPQVPNYPSYWDASAGGHVDAGETPEEAAYRELNEELGLKNIPLKLIDKFYFQADEGRTYRYYANVYSGEIGAQTITTNPDEVTDTRFFTSEEVGTLTKVTPITRKILEQL